MTEDPAAMVARLAEVWAAHDADGYAELFAPDGTLILPGVYLTGRRAIRGFVAARFAGPLRGTRLTGRPLEVRRLGPGVAVLIVAGGVLVPGETEPPPARAIRASWTLVHGDEGWRLAVYHNCPRD